MPDNPTILQGAEAWSADGGPNGALVLHGFTGNPSSMRGLAEALAAEGFAVELPRLPGHGTTIEDMAETGWSDWSSTAEQAYSGLASRCERVVVVGLSMGGTLTAWLAGRHAEISGIAVVNPSIEPPAEAFRDVVRQAVAQGIEVFPGVGGDVADPESKESSYEGTPLRAALTMFDGHDDTFARLSEIKCPVLIITSRQDHVVPTVSSDVLAENVSGPVERVWLERSYHVATIDYEKRDVESRVVEFARKVTAS